MENLQTVVLGGGCFWCIEAVFDRMQGVASVESGYMGGPIENPTYRQVCNGDTGHVEVVRVNFDPSQTSLHEVLEVFFTVHDPTTLNRQGNDVGTQYRSAIFYASEEQYREAKKVIEEINAAHIWPAPIVTSLEPASKFYIAEDYHQEYFTNNGNQPYCQFVVAPAQGQKVSGEVCEEAESQSCLNSLARCRIQFTLGRAESSAQFFLWDMLEACVIPCPSPTAS